MSPDSDAVKWIVVVAALLQTTAAVIQLRQGRMAGKPASPAAAVSGPLKLGVLASVASVLWVGGVSYLYERQEFAAAHTVYYTLREGFQHATFLRVLLFIGDLVTPGLGCAAVVAITKGIVVGRLDMSQTLVHVVALVASAASMFVAVAQISIFGSDVLWLAVIVGVGCGLNIDQHLPSVPAGNAAPSGPQNDHQAFEANRLRKELTDEERQLRELEQALEQLWHDGRGAGASSGRRHDLEQAVEQAQREVTETAVVWARVQQLTRVRDPLVTQLRRPVVLAAARARQLPASEQAHPRGNAQPPRARAGTAIRPAVVPGGQPASAPSTTLITTPRNTKPLMPRTWRSGGIVVSWRS